MKQGDTVVVANEKGKPFGILINVDNFSFIINTKNLNSYLILGFFIKCYFKKIILTEKNIFIIIKNKKKKKE